MVNMQSSGGRWCYGLKEIDPASPSWDCDCDDTPANCTLDVDGGVSRVHVVRNGLPTGSEMSFPGGKQDPQDASLEETALRECEEELGVPRENIHVMGCFDDHITPQKFVITPVVGFIDQEQELLKCEEEVHEILKVPVNFFVNKKNYRERTYELNGDTIGVGKFNYRDPDGKKYVIFGATCHIIATYVDLVHDAGLVKPGVRRLSPADFNARDQKIKKE